MKDSLQWQNIWKCDYRGKAPFLNAGNTGHNPGKMQSDGKNKITEEIKMDIVTQKKVDQLVEIKDRIAELSTEKAKIEGYFLVKAEEEIKNTKVKTVSYVGNYGNRVAVTMADSLNILSPENLDEIFLDDYDKYVSERITYKIDPGMATTLKNICLGRMNRTTIKEVLDELKLESGVRSVIDKKVKGIKFDKDKQVLIDIAGLDEETAEHFAYFVKEAATWENLMKMILTTGYGDIREPDSVIKVIKDTMEAKEIQKVTVTAGK